MKDCISKDKKGKQNESNGGHTKYANKLVLKIIIYIKAFILSKA